MVATHEKALMRDIMSRIEQIAGAEGATRVTGVQLRLGALSHLKPAHVREHFAAAAHGTLAEGAVVDAEIAGDATSAHARDVILESVELELPDRGSSESGSAA
jgi:Zn finger protein HypA/HybF involved in hydrogenase expression